MKQNPETGHSGKPIGQVEMQQVVHSLTSVTVVGGF